MFERTKDNSLPYPENLVKAMGFDKNDNIDIEELYDTVQYRTTPPNKELLIEYFRDNIKMSDLGKMHNLSTERIRQKIRLSMYDIRRYILKQRRPVMNWNTYNYRAWLNGMQNNSMMNMPYMTATTDIGTFAILPHYSSRFKIRYMSVWLQTPDMKATGGENFGAKMRRCTTFEDGKSIAQAIYMDIKRNTPSEIIGTQYLDSDIPISDPFAI